MWKAVISYIEQVAGKNRIEKEIIEEENFEKCFRMTIKTVEINAEARINEIHIYQEKNK